MRAPSRVSGHGEWVRRDCQRHARTCSRHASSRVNGTSACIHRTFSCSTHARRVHTRRWRRIGEHLGVARRGTRERGCSGADIFPSTCGRFQVGAAGRSLVVHADSKNLHSSAAGAGPQEVVAGAQQHSGCRLPNRDASEHHQDLNCGRGDALTRHVEGPLGTFLLSLNDGVMNLRLGCAGFCDMAGCTALRPTGNLLALRASEWACATRGLAGLS